MKPRREVILDLQATLLRKPTAAPLITPREAIAIALTSAQWVPGRVTGPESTVVDLVLKALDQSGWKIEAK